jgi:hypothetical protein
MYQLQKNTNLSVDRKETCTWKNLGVLLGNTNIDEQTNDVTENSHADNQ